MTRNIEVLGSTIPLKIEKMLEFLILIDDLNLQHLQMRVKNTN